MSRKYIGVFDSGLGGLTTVSEIIRQLPDENIVFIGDTANMPYGSKTKEQIISFTLNNIHTLLEHDLKAVVIACNTSDSNARNVAEKEFDLPIFGVISPAARKAAEITACKKIGVIATELTVKSERYEKLIKEHDSDIEVYQMACPKLVPLVESGLFLSDKNAMIRTLKDYIDPLYEKGIDTLILGCTHYDILMDLTSEIYPDLKLVSSSRPVVFDLKEYLEKNDLREKEKEAVREYYTTSDPEEFAKIAQLLIKDIEIKQRVFR